MRVQLYTTLTLCWLLAFSRVGFCQQSSDGSDNVDKAINFPSKFFNKIQSKTASLNQQLTRQTEKYLQRLAKREERLQKKIYKIDSVGAKNLFANSSQQYAALLQKLRSDTGNRNMPLTGEYQPNLDSLKSTLSFLQQNPQLLASTGSTTSNLPNVSNLSPQMQAQLQGSISQLQALQAKMMDADQIKQYVHDRESQLGQYISQHASLQGLLNKQYQGMNQDLYYYSQQVRQYKEMLNNPDQLEQKALSLLNQLPAFQGFMKNNSQLAGLFSLPGNYGSAQGLTGLQTTNQIGQLIQSQISAGGAGGASAFQADLQSAESQLDNFKNKLSQLGSGSGDIDMPNFKPNDQKTKTFLKRIEYGIDIQTSRTSYLFPTVTDIGLSLGYKLGHSNTIGIGGSFKLGWGNGISHVALSGQGVGLRSFVDIKLKGSFFISGGLEYNYETPFTSYRELPGLVYWTKSGLIGVSETLPVKNRFVKQTKLQLLWDFLSYYQVPRTQPIVFRVGYNF